VKVERLVFTPISTIFDYRYRCWRKVTVQLVIHNTELFYDNFRLYIIMDTVEQVSRYTGDVQER